MVKKSSASSLMQFLRQPAYAGQPVSEVTVPCTSYILTTTVTTGAIANTFGLQTTSIVNFATRYGDLWSEYAIVGCKFEITPLTYNSPGVTVFYLDDSSAAVPTLNESMGRIVKKLSNSCSNKNSTTQLSWTARSLTDLTFNTTALSYAAIYLKTFTDNTNYGSPVVATQLWLVRPVISMILRGLRSV